MCDPILNSQPSKKYRNFGVLGSSTEDAEFEDPGSLLDGAPPLKLTRRLEETKFVKEYYIVTC
jgi:hypothetical protein